LCAPWLWLGLDPWTVGLWICLLAAGLTVVPLVRIAEHVRPGAGAAAGVLWASSPLLARNAAEVFSEPPFLLAMALGTVCGQRRQWWRVGCWSGLAFWIRPEGVLLAASFALAERRRALLSLLPLAAWVLAQAAQRWWPRPGFDPLPMLAFHEHERNDLPERGQWFINRLRNPWAWIEAFGPAGLLPLVFLLPKQRADSRGLLPLLWQIVLQIGAVCSFVTRRRFLLSAAVPALALAGAALAGLGARWRRTLLALLAAIGLILGWKGVTDADRVAEREVGEYLGTLLQPDDQIAGDLTRVMWFAGRRPLWPRHYTDDELLAMAAPPEVRFVVLSAGTKRRERDQFDALEAGLRQHFDRLVLPAGLEASARERGLAVFVRR
jgi:hypothetical protein